MNVNDPNYMNGFHGHQAGGNLSGQALYQHQLGTQKREAAAQAARDAAALAGKNR